MADACPVEVEVRASSGSKRVSAPRPLPLPPAGSAPGLLQRQLLGPALSEREHRWRSFSQFKLRREWDLYCPHPGGHWWPPFYLRRRTAVREVVAAAGLVIALADSGVCAAFHQAGGAAPLCYLNVEADEVVRSLYINRLNATLITVSVFSGDAFRRLHVRATPLASIRAGQPHTWRPLFDSEVLRWPGFVEFDDVNNVAVTFSAETRRFKVFDLRAPLQPLFHIDGTGVRDLKICSGGVLLLTMLPERPGELPLRVLGLADGSCLQELCLPLKHSASSSGRDGTSSNGEDDSSATDSPSDPSCGGHEGLEVVELFGGHLLVKEAGGPLCILNITSGAERRVPAAEFPAPSAFIHLPFNNSFLAFWQAGDAQLWSFDGRLLASLPHVALPSAAAIDTVFVSTPQDLMCVYCPPGRSAQRCSSCAGATAAGTAAAAAAAGGGEGRGGGGRPAAAAAGVGAGQQGPGGSFPGSSSHLANTAHQGGCIRVFDLLSGRQVAVVQAQHAQQGQGQQQGQRQASAPPGSGSTTPSRAAGEGCSKQQAQAAAAAAALRHVTSLFYDEAPHRVFTGTADGRLQAWGV